MLKTRVITALALMALLLPSIFMLPQADWALLVAAFIGVAAWEWGALLGWQESARRTLGVATALICAAVSFAFPGAMGVGATVDVAQPWVFLFYGLAAIFWCLVMPFWLRNKWALQGGVVGLLVGAVVLLPTWLAMVQLRILGPAVLLAIFAVVWMADIAAYFSGKAFGKHKLAPTISPGKTWEGAVGAAVGVVIYGLVVRAAFSLESPALPLWVLLLLGVTAISIIGDLYESLLKRKAGIKDSSNVLPGHGGVLDRIDSLTSTLPVVALLWLLISHGAS
ncbi:phosphatidate cytidylyltransferase [Dechloromonas sp. TW-R-39-2]|uniref:phosphatidate cytidylyltransferase n=1 Tax=Dechloromonas sp. TW-R-39-2 TaxID=2654218 RepID=UPI00193D9F81|nr:phosphatidate cytidylyltransferase [Dechloromonas sp. TW-R-39-2]QRM19632.1 phosphatidate cytidylyltransferase [Dechloromonas sp. TW-R-39-2]